jgi:hypothetical protein
MKILKIFCLFIIIVCSGSAQINQNRFISDMNEYNSRFLGNGFGSIKIQNNTIWTTSGKGLSKSSDNGNSWYNYYGTPEFIKPVIYGFDILGSKIWCALGYIDTEQPGDPVTSAGFTFSSNTGLTWTQIPPVLDSVGDSLIIYGNNKLYALPIIKTQQNVTYSLSLTDKTVWINSWSGGLRKSTDFGKTFTRVLLPSDSLNSIKPSDTLKFLLDPRSWRTDGFGNYNHLGFSVLAINENEIWAGTAGGVNKSTDGGISWNKFTFNNQDSAISGNWIIAICQQKYKTVNRIWLASWSTGKTNEEYGASYTENGGKSWKVVLKGKKVIDYGFKDSIIYIATEGGLYRSEDNAKTFQLFDNIVDAESRYRIMSISINAIDVKNDTVWIGTSDGLVYTIDNSQQRFGSKWKILRAYQSVETNKSYAYPNPFAPPEIVRIHYKMPNNNCKVSVEIFDFGMNLIRHVVSNVTRTGNLEQEEIWNGKDEFSNRTPNGTYFYRIKMDDQYSWGKIIVLQ